MRIMRVVVGLILLLICIRAQAQTPVNEVSGTGKLTRIMGIGGESTGWEIQFDSPTMIEGKEMPSIQVRLSDPKQGQKNENKHVQVTGSVVHRHGPETGETLILEVTSIKVVKPAK